MDVQVRQPIRYRYWRALPLIIYSLMCYFMTGVVSGIINVAAVLYEHDRGWDATLLTSAVSVAALLNVVAGYIAGRMMARRSAKPMCVIWGVLFIIGVLVMGVSAHIGTFLVAMCVTNAASSAWGYNTVPVFITRWFPTKKGTVQGFASMGILLGSVTSMVYTWAYRTFGPAFATVPFALFGLVALMILMVCISDWPEQKGLMPDTMERCEPIESPSDSMGASMDGNADLGRKAPAASEVKRFLSHPVFVLLTVVLGIQLVYAGGIMVQLVPRLIEAGFTLDESALIMMLASLLACVGSFAAGVIGDRFGAKVGVCVTFAVGAAGVVLNLVPNNIMVILGVVCIGCVVGSADNWPVTICAELFDRSTFPQVFGGMFPTIQLVGALGPALVAQVARLFGGYHVAYVLLAVLMVVGAVSFPPLMRIVQE